MVRVDELAAIYGWRKSWIYKKAEARAIPHYKKGRYLEFRLSEVEAWVQAGRVEPVNG